MTNQTLSTRLYVRGLPVAPVEDRIFAQQCIDEPFVGFDTVRETVAAHVRNRLGGCPAATFDNVLWTVCLEVYGPALEGHPPLRTGKMLACWTDADFVPVERLAFRRWSRPETLVFNLDDEEAAYLCVCNHDFWGTCHGPDSVVGALSESYEPWALVCDEFGDGAPLAWIHLRTGEVTTRFVALNATAMGDAPVRRGGPS